MLPRPVPTKVGVFIRQRHWARQRCGLNHQRGLFSVIQDFHLRSRIWRSVICRIVLNCPVSKWFVCALCLLVCLLYLLLPKQHLLPAANTVPPRLTWFQDCSSCILPERRPPPGSHCTLLLSVLQSVVESLPYAPLLLGLLSCRVPGYYCTAIGRVWPLVVW